MKNQQHLTCGIRHFRLGILIIYKLIIKVVPLSSDSEAESGVYRHRWASLKKDRTRDQKSTINANFATLKMTRLNEK